MCTKQNCTIIKLTPEVRGCYGPRVWVLASNQELNSIFKVLSVFGTPTDQQVRACGGNPSYEKCYELPFGFTSTDIWKNIVSRLNLIVKEG